MRKLKQSKAIASEKLCDEIYSIPYFRFKFNHSNIIHVTSISIVRMRKNFFNQNFFVSKLDTIWFVSEKDDSYNFTNKPVSEN